MAAKANANRFVPAKMSMQAANRSQIKSGIIAQPSKFQMANQPVLNAGMMRPTLMRSAVTKNQRTNQTQLNMIADAAITPTIKHINPKKSTLKRSKSVKALNSNLI